MSEVLKILTIAGSDPSGGAGIQCDIKTVVKLGGYTASVITTITAQNSRSVDGMWPLESSVISAQLDSVLSDFMPDAVKIGLIGSAEAVDCISSSIKNFNLKNIVFDPVLSPTLLSTAPSEQLIKLMASRLLPLCTLVTPNIPEKDLFEKVTQTEFYNLCEAFLLKGGHDEGAVCIDRLFFNIYDEGISRDPSSAFPSINFNHSSLFDNDSLVPLPADGRGNNVMIEFKHKRLSSGNTHGSGCVLSSAIAFYLAKGLDLEVAVKNAIDFFEKALKKSSSIKLFNGDYGPSLV